MNKIRDVKIELGNLARAERNDHKEEDDDMDKMN